MSTDMTGEFWKPVDGWPYEVSSHGNVRRFGRPALARRMHTNGYVRVHLCDGISRRLDAYVHRLVCEAFHGKPPRQDMHADHIDGDRANNRSDNLRWLSPEENRALRNLQKGERHSHAKLTEDAVRYIRSTPRDQANNVELARLFQVSRETIRDTRNGKQWRHINA